MGHWVNENQVKTPLLHQIPCYQIPVAQGATVYDYSLILNEL